MTALKALGHIGWLVDYYDDVHDATCACWKSDEIHQNLKFCTCKAGKAYFALYQKLIGKKYVKT